MSDQETGIRPAPLFGDGDGISTRVKVENGRAVLVKTFPSQSPSKSLLEAFRLECETLSKIIHPGLPVLIRHEANGDEFTIVLGLPEGGLPADLVATGSALSVEQALHVARELCQVVYFLHSQKPFPVIHRNLNPHTLYMKGAYDEIRLLDFGFPSFLNLSAAKKAPAKNRIRLNSFHDPLLLSDLWADPRVDVYSFGMLLRFWLSISGEVRQVRGTPSRDNSADEDIRMALLGIADTCTAKTPSDRFPDFAALALALEGVHSSSEGASSRRVRCKCGHMNRPNAKFCENCSQGIQVSCEIGVSITPDRGEGQELPSINAQPEFTYDGEAEGSLLVSHRENRFSNLARYRMMEALHAIESDPGFEELLSLQNLPEVAKMKHQKDAVLRALQQMRGRALFADEVGLGKTVEAGIFLKELLIRRLADKILILCPSILLAAQWQSELYDKFGEIALVFGHDIDSSLAWHCSRLIATYDTLRHPFHVEELLRHRYDLVILDEAHFLNEEENAGVLGTVRELQKKYFLMLSATPMNRSLRELYNIVTLLRPGHFADLASFEREFMEADDEMRAKNVTTLRTLLHQIMVRNRRQDVTDYVFPRRKAILRKLTLPPDARKFFDEVRDFLKSAVASVSNTSVLGSIGELAERLCSSPDAFSSHVNRLRRNRRVQQVLGDSFLGRMEAFSTECPDSIAEPKVRAAIEILEKHTETGDRALAFSQFDETARYFYRRLGGTTLKSRCFLYNPEESPAARQRAVRKLEETPGGILVCPPEASEGLNLQSANLMVNLDLPWNPMKLEQRIGRIQRIGGKKDVLIMNLVLQGTIEEKIYEICERRIEMFEAIVGHVEEILGNLDEDVEVLIRDFYLSRETVDDEGEKLSAEERLNRSFDDAESKSSKPAEESLSRIYGSAEFDPSMAEEEED